MSLQHSSEAASGPSSSCTILYSTQTGRARACARRTARILREKTCLKLLGGTSFDEMEGTSFVESASAACQDNNNNHFFLFFVSTTGDGVNCDTIQNTWKSLLRKSLPTNLFQGGSFALFCLGDRAYGPQFCAAGRKLAVRLMQLGMKTKCEIGYGDDNTPNGGVFADLDQWIEKHLLNSLPQDISIQQQQLSSTTSTPRSNSNAAEVDASHYRVVVQDKSTVTPPDNNFEEWKQEWCQQSYQVFFQHRGPMTAYGYANQQRVDGIVVEENNPLLALVESNSRLTAPDWDQNTRHIRLRVASSTGDVNTPLLPCNDERNLPYQAGDIASVLPSNPPAEVQRFIETLPETIQAIVDAPLDLEFISGGQQEVSFGGAYPYWPRHCTLRGWLTCCADIHSLPEREDLRALSRYCSPLHDMYEGQRDKLFSLSETSESALYVDYILREKRCWTDVFYDFDSLRDAGSLLSVEALLTMLPPIRPRDFSIASSPSREVLLLKRQQQTSDEGTSQKSVNEFFLELCVAVVEGTTPLGRNYHGLCSHYISQLEPLESHVRLWIRPGSFAGLPMTPCSTETHHKKNQWFENPVLCIGAGTGIAPLRALILEREAVRTMIRQGASASESLVDEDLGDNQLDDFDNILVFGCRKKDVDYYYEDEWKQLHQDGRLFLLPAFSREQARKVYVQQVIKANGDAILKHVLENDGAIYIAGNPSMARYSKEELVDAAGRLLGEDGDKKATIVFKKLQARGRFSVEAWS